MVRSIPLKEEFVTYISWDAGGLARPYRATWEMPGFGQEAEAGLDYRGSL